MHSGQRKIDRWTAQHRCVVVEFDDAAAFFNANTLAELQQPARHLNAPPGVRAAVGAMRLQVPLETLMVGNLAEKSLALCAIFTATVRAIRR